MFKSVIETIFIFMVLSLLSRHFCKAEPLNLAQLAQNDFHQRFGRFRRAAADDSVVFPKEDASNPKTANAQPELPKAAGGQGEANKNGTELESRFFGPFAGLGQGLLGALGGGGRGNGFGGGFGGPDGGFGGPGYYNRYPGQYGGGYNPGYGGGFGGPGFGGPGYGGPGFGFGR